MILADENMPEVHRYFERFGDIRTAAGKAIDREALADVDVLLVRSVTRVNRSLLEGTRVRFVGSATIGTDHVDLEALRQMDVQFAHAPGSNADSVAEYVIAAMLEAMVATDDMIGGKTLGVIGYGDIGKRVARRASALGMHVLVNDPPLESQGVKPAAQGGFQALADVLENSDVVTLHVPLTNDGPYPTDGLISAQELARMKRGALLINTSRGVVVRGRDLLTRLRREDGFRAVLDVFENEPRPDIELMEHLFITTPHIAGYSLDGKINGTRMLYEALCRIEGVNPDTIEDDVTKEESYKLIAPSEKKSTRWLRSLVRQMYDVRDDDRRMREMLSLPVDEREAYFNRLRKTYPVRRTFNLYEMPGSSVPHELVEVVASGLQVRLT